MTFPENSLPVTTREIQIPPSWNGAIEHLTSTCSKLMILGAPDTGKSTLSLFLVHHFCQMGRKVVLIDADLGQNNLGLPTTICMNLFDTSLPQCDEGHPPYMGFVGSTTPSRHVVPTLVTTYKLIEKSTEYQPEIVIINTDGMVFGNEARILKSNLISLICPQAIIALQHAGEIEHLLKLCAKGVSIYRLPVSEKARKKSPVERKTIREQKFFAYFKDVTCSTLSLENIVVSGQDFSLGAGTPLSLNDRSFLSRHLLTPVYYAEKSTKELLIIVENKETLPHLAPIEEYFRTPHITIKYLPSLIHTLVALNGEEGFALALAIVQSIDFEKKTLTIVSPLPPEKHRQITKIIWGSLRLDNQGKELGTEPGNFRPL